MDLYREEILEHWQNPLNFGVIDDADLVIEQVNPLCGDEVTFYFKFRKKQKEKSKKFIAEIKFTGSGCAISIASASILSERIKNKSVKSLSQITGKDVLKLIGGSLRRQGSGGQAVIPPARLKCVFLSLEVIKKIR